METQTMKTEFKKCKICGATVAKGHEGECPNKKNHYNIENGIKMEENKAKEIESLIETIIEKHVKKYHSKETEDVKENGKKTNEPKDSKK